MINRQLPKPKKRPAGTQTNAMAGQPTPRIGRIAHELMNQLSVLNLIGYNVVSRNQSRSAATIARDVAIFERSIREASLLAEQLAHYLASQENNSPANQPSSIAVQGQVVRILRSVSNLDR